VSKLDLIRPLAPLSGDRITANLYGARGRAFVLENKPR
jgi:hypothetical protein